MSYPLTRGRRLRRTAVLRDLVAETTLSPADLIVPLFVADGLEEARPISSMPGVAQLPVREAADQAARAYDLGVRAVLLFGIPAEKDDEGSSSWQDEGIVQQAIRAIKERVPEVCVITDVCLCEYTSHGHCGVLRGETVDNDATLPLLARQAVSHAAAGADVVAPSDMMDGRVGALRQALDRAGYAETAILSYAAKYASGFYGPFREAAESTPAFGDRRSYQMDPRNAREALREVALDLGEGADMVMVKPALAYLDVVRRVRDAVDVPVVAYNVSGEYAMIKAAVAAGWLEERRVVEEVLTAIKRAGADMIITYHAFDAARWWQPA